MNMIFNWTLITIQLIFIIIFLNLVNKDKRINNNIVCTDILLFVKLIQNYNLEYIIYIAEIY